MSKGDWTRPHDKKKFDAGFEAIFGKKKLNVWEDPPNDGTPEDREGNSVGRRGIEQVPSGRNGSSCQTPDGSVEEA